MDSKCKTMVESNCQSKLWFIPRGGVGEIGGLWLGHNRVYPPPPPPQHFVVFQWSLSLAINFLYFFPSLYLTSDDWSLPKFSRFAQISRWGITFNKYAGDRYFTRQNQEPIIPQLWNLYCDWASLSCHYFQTVLALNFPLNKKLQGLVN